MVLFLRFLRFERLSELRADAAGVGVFLEYFLKLFFLSVYERF